MLTSLEIQGFKSFPDYTEINFHKGITAIVGPNGAGKSNITDAVRWVLGEQSAKTLRGQRMEDVIFNGTAQRRPVSFCEVTLTFDNSKGILAIDYETVAITRRYYRSGDSEYLINKTPCRLRDINALLMDTGIGLDGYSIIGQGRIDEILSNKSEDRRAIFEEASGIVQFRSRKDEALRKLNRSQDNLVRVDDLLNELHSQAQVLEKQAEDARSHIDLADRYRRLDTALTLRQIENLEAQKAKREEDAGLMKADLDQARQAQVQSRTAYEDSLARVKSLDQEVEADQIRFNDYSVEETELRGLDALYKEKYASSKKGAESLLEEKNRLVMQVMATEEDLVARQTRRQDLLVRRQEARDQLLAAKSELDEIESSFRETGQQLQSLMTRRGQLAEALASSGASLEAQSGQAQALMASLASLEERKALLAAEADKQREELTRQAIEKEALEAVIADREEARIQARKETETGHQNADLLESSIQEARRMVKQALYEAETLERLEADYEGYSRSVQAIMKEAARGKGEGLYGPLGSLLTVEAPYQEAIETALGASTHHLVCDGPEKAEEWIGWLRQKKAGRATFLPVGALSVRSMDQRTLDQAQKAEGWVGLAADLVSCQAQVLPAVRYSLGRTMVVKTLDQAIALSQKTGRAYTVVTLDGDQVNRGGSMTGGYRSSQTKGVLGRPGRIQAARREAAAREDEIARLQERLEAAKESLRQFASREEALLESLADDRRTLVRLTAEEKAAGLALDRLVQELERHEGELAQSLEREQRLNLACQTLEAEIQRLTGEREALSAELTGLDAQHREGQANFDQARDLVTRLEVSLTSLEESLASFDEVTQVSQKEIDSARSRLASVEREWADQTHRMEEARQAIEDNDLALARAVDKRQACQESLARLMEAREEEASGQRSLLTAMNTANDSLASLQAVYERQDADIQRMTQQVDDQVNRLWETHGLTRFEAQEEAEELASINKATSERAALKRRIDDLGPINHNAIRDYEALRARIDYTESQRQDIENAQADLEGIIRDLDQSMREQFNRTLHEINQNFNQVFSELFSGGQAQIILEGETDILDADIGIEAQPPGKKLQKLSLLSGGERSLTAIALLFAILKLKPAPFCVFDEVESALDDANVRRFTDYVRRYAWSMQFILVTHRKGTMEASDRLYGVTMQERGISRVLSMVLSSALPYGS